MPGRDNTTKLNGGPIGDGSVGLSSDIHSSVGQQIDRIVSENNLNAALSGKDKSLTGLVEATIQMVDKWLPGDKLRILQEFGSTNGVDPSKPEQLNKAVAIALISSLPKNELRTIIGKKAANEAKAVKELKTANAHAVAQAQAIQKEYAASIKIRERYENGGDDASSTDALLKNMASSAGNKNASKPGKNGTFALEDIVCKTTIPNLQKEVNDVLKAFSDMEITTLANRLKIKFTDGCSRKLLTKKITNLILHFAATVLGKSKGMYASRFDPVTTEGIKDILKLTKTHGYLSGQAGLNDDALKLLRENAAKARKDQAMNLKKMKDRDKVYKRKTLATDFYDAEGNFHLIGFQESNSKIKSDKASWRILGRLIDYGSNSKKITEKIANIEKVMGLEKMTDEQKLAAISPLAKKMNVDIGGGKSYSEIMSEIAAIMVSEDNSNRKKLNQILKIKDPNKRKAQLTAFNSDMKKSSGALLAKARDNKLDSDVEQEYSDKIPVITLTKSGEPLSAAGKAVPVWVVGQGKIDSEKVKRQKNVKDREDQYYGDQVTAEDTFGLDKLLHSRVKKNKWYNKFHLFNQRETDGQQLADELMDKKPGDTVSQHEKNKTWHNLYSKYKDKYNANMAQKMEWGGNNITNVSMTPFNANTSAEMGVAGALGVTELGNKQADIIARANKYYDGLLSDELKNHKAASSLKKNSAAYGMLSEDEENGNPQALSTFKEHMNKITMKVYPSGTFQKDVMPVFEISKTPEYMEELRDSNNDILSAVSSIDTVVAQLPTLFIGLQQGGTAFNVESAMAGVATAVSTVTEVAKVAAKNMSASATGSHIRARKRHDVSSIVTGDARRGTNNKANPELVNVDWASRKIDVQPVPAFSTGGTAKQQKDNSNISTMNRMTSGERNKPLSVGISSSLVSYTKKLTDVTDDGSNTAVKVYSINSGINDKIKVGDKELSLFDAVYGMLASVVSIESTLNNNSQILGIIASNTTAISTNTARASTSSGGSPFEFPTSLDAVLAGD